MEWEEDVGIMSFLNEWVMIRRLVMSFLNGWSFIIAIGLRSTNLDTKITTGKFKGFYFTENLVHQLFE